MRALPRLLDIGRGIRRAIVERVAGGRAICARALAGARRAALLPSDGGWSAVIELANVDEEAICLQLAEERGVLVQPGYFFDFDRGAHAVISLLSPAGDLERGLASFRELVG
jgi:aspartate/methionine/tyrosine aminotransferase